MPFKVVLSSEIYNSAEIQPNATVDFQRNAPLRQRDAIRKRIGVAAPGQKIIITGSTRDCFESFTKISQRADPIIAW